MKSHAKQTSANNILHISTPKKTIGNPLSIKITNLSLVKPLASPVLYEQKDVRNVFMVFLLLIIIGEFFSAPAIALAVKLFFSFLFNSFNKIFYLGYLYVKYFESKYRTIRATTHVWKFRLGPRNIYCCNYTR